MKIYDFTCEYGDESRPTVTMKLYDVDGKNMASIRNLASRGDEIKIARDDPWGDYMMAISKRSYAKKDVEANWEPFNIRFADIKVEKVIFNNPATIIFWSDNTKTVVKCDNDDIFDPETGFYIACAKKLFGNNFKAVGRMNKALDVALDEYLKKMLRKGANDGKTSES